MSLKAFLQKTFWGKESIAMIFGTAQAPPHEESWNSYFTRIEDFHASVFLDMGFKAIAPLAKFSMLLAVDMQYLDYDDNGLPTVSQAQDLFEIEEALSEALKSGVGGLFVGRKTYHMQREFYFYCPSDRGDGQNVKDIVTQVFGDYPDYAISVDCGADPDWAHYLERLYPSEEERQTMNNMSLLSELSKQGDDLKARRMVQHWGYFREDNLRALFKGEIEEQGFEIIGEHFHDDNSELPFAISFRRKNKIGFQYINALTLPLFHLAKQYNGHYDGWEVEVQSDGTSEA